MGRAKEMMLEREALLAQAVDVLEAAGAVSRCEGHEDIYIDTGDPDAVTAAYAIGTNWLKDGRVFGPRDELMQAIKTAHDEAAMSCSICDND